MLKPGKYLITTDGWFYGPDGHQYRAVYGQTEVFEAKESLGFVPQRSANWFVRIGTEKKHIIVAGCQIHYAIRTDETPAKRIGKYPDSDTHESLPLNRILFLDDDD